MLPMAVGQRYLHEDFERGVGPWKASGGHDAIGWHRLRAAACGGQYTMVLGRERNLPFETPGLGADLTLDHPLDLRHARHPRLQYDLKGVTDPLGLVTLRAYARRPGAVWHPIGAPGHARYPVVATFTADLTPYAGGPVELRFHGEVGPSRHPVQGLYLDDINVVEPRVEVLHPL